MNATISNPELDGLLGDWLAEGPTVMSSVALTGALNRVSTTRQARGWPMPGALSRWLPVQRWQPALRMVALVVVLGSLVVAAAAITALLRPPPLPSPQPTASAALEPTPTPVASAVESRAASLATGVASVEVTGSTSAAGEWVFAGTRESDIPGLSVYAFYTTLRTPSCGCAGGPNLRLYLDPTATFAVGDTTPTGATLVVGISFQLLSGRLDAGEYLNSFQSRAGECTMTFSTFTDATVEGDFACIDMPSLNDGDLINAVGSFSFDPREFGP